VGDHRRRAVVAVERVGAGDGAEQQHPDAVDVGSVVEGRAAHLLGRHAVGGAEDHAGTGDGLVVGDLLHQAEVDHLHVLVALLVALDQQVAGLQIAVHDAALVGVAQGAAHLQDQVHRVGWLQRTGLDQVGEAGALDELHHEEVAAVGQLAEVVERDDVGVVEGGEGLGLEQEALLEVGGQGVVVGGAQHLDRHAAVHPQLARDVDRGHAAFRDAPLDHVAASDDAAGLRGVDGTGGGGLAAQRTELLGLARGPFGTVYMPRPPASGQPPPRRAPR
jgi:hypothetical protein